MSKLIIGTRKSNLAQIQTSLVTSLLLKHFPDLDIEEKLISTKGDKILDSSLSKIGDKGLFTREIENHLLDNSIHLAVHSYKDLPTELPEGLRISAVIKREAPEDVLVGKSGVTLLKLPHEATIGTDSIRRRAQLLHHRPDLKVISVRGNVETRIKKLDSGLYDAIVLAKAGLIRLNLESRISSELMPGIWYHAVSQGAMAIEIRKDNAFVKSLLEPLNHQPTRYLTNAERALLRELEGGCQVPIGVRSYLENDTLTLYGMVAGLNGSPFIEACEIGKCMESEKIGKSVAAKLINQGADKILKEIEQNR